MKVHFAILFELQCQVSVAICEHTTVRKRLSFHTKILILTCANCALYINNRPQNVPHFIVEESASFMQ